jgi:hypothetical protein
VVWRIRIHFKADFQECERSGLPCGPAMADRGWKAIANWCRNASRCRWKSGSETDRPVISRAIWGKASGVSDQGHHRQKQLAGVKLFREQSFGLLPAEPFDGPHGVLAAVALVDHLLFTPLQGFPFEQTDPLRVAAGDVEPKGQAFDQGLRRGRQPRGAFGQLPPQDFAEQTLLVAEIVIEHPLVDARPAGDGVHPRPGKTLGGKFPQCGFENPLLTVQGIAAAGLF